MNQRCPLCREPLREYHRIADNTIVVYCTDVLNHSLTQSNHLYLEGTGHSTQEALKHFLQNCEMKTRILHVSTQFWSARCRWVFRDGKWEAVIFDKQLNFLKGLTPEQAKVELEKLGAKWTWEKVEDKPAPSVC